MPKIVKNGLEYSGTPLEEVTAWPPTGDSVQIEQPLMGNTDISEVGDGTVTGAIDALNNGLPYLQEITGTTTAAGLLTLTIPFNKVISANVVSTGVNWYVLTRKAGSGNAACFIFDNGFTSVNNTDVTLAIWRLP